MKLVFFDDFRLGVLRDNLVVDVSATVHEIPHTGPHDLISGLIARFGHYRWRLQDAAYTGTAMPIDNMHLRAPTPKPSST